MRGILLIAITVSLCWVTADSARAEGPETNERVTVWSGVSYQDLKIGTGSTVRPGQRLTCHTTGWLLDGTKFWSSRDDGGSPYTFRLAGGAGGVINGMVDGLPGMKVGGLRKLWVPAEHAYAKNGFGKVVPPDSDLIFEVEVFAAEKFDKAQ